MNQPPAQFRRVPHTQLHAFVSAAARTAGLVPDRAELLADLLTANDLRGVFSHGTRQVATYARLMRDGRLNPAPRVATVRQTPVSLLVDGDGGLGYFPAHDGTRQLIDKALAQGLGVLLTRNHGHFGAAGLYARLTLEHDLLCFVTSGHQLHLQAGAPLYDAAGGSPMAFSAPAGEEDPLVLDFGTMHDLYGGRRDELSRLAPGIVLRSIGQGEICQAWGGLLSGLRIDPDPPRWTWPGANQGALVIAWRIDLFAEPAQFRRQMDEYVRRVRGLRPLPGLAEAYLAGGAEAARQRQYRAEGVPVGPEHEAVLEKLAAELGIAVPWK
ncbi:MAG: Ldh family oxidoreductase [Candidatus Latescibacterota bacterium]